MAKKLNGAELRPHLCQHLMFAFDGWHPDDNKNLPVPDMKPMFRLFRQFLRPVIRREFIWRHIWIQNLGTHHITNIGIYI